MKKLLTKLASRLSSIIETLYLYSIPGVRESIIEGMETPNEDFHSEEDLEW